MERYEWRETHHGGWFVIAGKDDPGWRSPPWRVGDISGPKTTYFLLLSRS